ncbi:hypothetical protein KAR91_83550, partial [Candidatus Pacearchaeota archaeon]|nr:hypothetical protein [Candidatus Pacearchaeota archaeon]
DVTTVAGISEDVSSVAALNVGWNFSTTTAMADPGSGNIRFNNATPASVTAIAVDDLDSNGDDVSAYVISWDDSINSHKGTLTVRQGSSFAIFTITGLTDNSGWTQLAVTYVTGSGSFADATISFSGFSRTGDTGGSVIITEDESSDTTCFPVFVLTATGSVGPKTDAAKYKYDSDTGTLRSTEFVGGGAALTCIKQAARGFQAHSASDRTQNATSEAIMPLEVESYDTQNEYDTVAYRYTPTVAGYYLFTLATQNTIANFFAEIRKNGTLASEHSATTDNHSVILYMNGSSDYVEPWANNDTGGNIQYFTTSIAPERCRFEGMLLGI